MNRFADESVTERAITLPIPKKTKELGDSLFRAADTVIIKQKSWWDSLPGLRTLSSPRFLFTLIIGLSAVVTILLALILRLHFS